MIITSSNSRDKKWIVAIIAIFLLLSLAAGFFYFASREVNLQREEVGQQSLIDSYSYVMNQDGTVDKNRVGINFVSTGDIRKMRLVDKTDDKDVGEVYVLKGYTYDISGRTRDLEVVVQAVHGETGENIYKELLSMIIQAERLDISISNVLSISQLEKIFPSSSNWRVETSIVGIAEAESGLTSEFLDFINALGEKDYYSSISRNVNSGLNEDFERVIMPESIYPYSNENDY